MIIILLVVIIISHYYPRMSSISLICTKSILLLVLILLDFSIFGFQGTNAKPAVSLGRMLRILSDDLSHPSGDGGIRTLDPLLARQVLSQLSYTPINLAPTCFPIPSPV